MITCFLTLKFLKIHLNNDTLFVFDRTERQCWGNTILTSDRIQFLNLLLTIFLYIYKLYTSKELALTNIIIINKWITCITEATVTGYSNHFEAFIIKCLLRPFIDHLLIYEHKNQLNNMTIDFISIEFYIVNDN